MTILTFLLLGVAPIALCACARTVRERRTERRKAIQAYYTRRKIRYTGRVL